MMANDFYSMISYPNYKFIFPIKALGMYAERFGDDALF
jgi:lanosterol synthase